MLSIYLSAAFIVISVVTILWVISVFIKNVSIVDIFWGFGFVLANATYLYFSGDLYLRKLVLFSLVTIWGLRLTIFLAWRNAGKGEDFRYQEFRRNYGAERYWWFSFFQVFLLQGILILLVSLPLLAVNSKTIDNEFNVIDIIAIVIWFIGFMFEAGGDFQLAKFKNNAENKGKVLRTGFWKYTRHPNYFGDSAVWWAFGLFSISVGAYWHALGSVIMTLIIIKVSGVSLLEKTLKNTKPQYKEYIEQTSSFIPWFPKTKKND